MTSMPFWNLTPWNASHDRKERFEQAVAELFELASRPDRHLTGAAARDDLKVGELDLERDGAAANAGALAVVPYLVVKLHLQFKQCQHIGGHRRALARGAPRPAGLRAREGWCPTRSMWARDRSAGAPRRGGPRRAGQSWSRGRRSGYRRLRRRDVRQDGSRRLPRSAAHRDRRSGRTRNS